MTVLINVLVSWAGCLYTRYRCSNERKSSRENAQGRVFVVEEPYPITRYEALELIARGCKNGEIATVLEIEERTVRFHIENILDKLNIKPELKPCAIENLPGFHNWRLSQLFSHRVFDML